MYEQPNVESIARRKNRNREREFNGRAATSCHRFEILERAKGIEPSYAAWEAAVLPLNYARVSLALSQDNVTPSRQTITQA
jgi:hypothetical protein